MRRGLNIGLGNLLTAGMILAAACFWVVGMQQADDAVFSRAPLLDELYYLDRSAEIREGAFLPDDPFFMSPLYPLLVAASGSGRNLTQDGTLPVGDLRALRWFQIGCWFTVFLLLRRITARMLAVEMPVGRWREFAAWIPSLLFALYRPAAIYTMGVLLELPLLLLSTIALGLLLHRELNLRRTIVLGVVLGLAMLLRGTVLMLLPVALFVGLRAAQSGRERMRFVLALLLPVALLAAPPAIHNSRLAERAAGPTMNAGLNLAIGNGGSANGFYRTLWDGDWRTDPAGTRHLAQQTGQASVSVAEADAIWWDAARQSVQKNPVTAFRLFAKKIWLHLQSWEIDQLMPLDGWNHEVPAVRGLFVPWRILIVLALAATGVLLMDREAIDPQTRRSVALLAGVLALLVAGQSLFFVVSRYRLILVPALCLLAGTGAIIPYRVAFKKSWRMWTPLGFGLIALFVSQPWGLGTVQSQWAAQAQANLAHRWAVLGYADESAPALQKAADLYSGVLAEPVTQAEWWLALALVQIERGESEEAEATLSEADDLHPGHLRIQQTLLGILLEQNRTEEALTRAETLLSDYPFDADTLHNTTILLARAGRRTEAPAMARRLVEAHPEDPRGYIDLGVLLARSGRVEEARRIFSDGLEAVPGHEGLQKNLSLLDR